ncbi:hypothetical protein [Rhizobium sophoriradicis]|uniref:Uncharacterized protein n=1 Tax=Rhizobium sophoriradicis TaxID=1535245 RepID=A0A2A5KVI0_9HYPH|nr:hypothetical protein [Rhizobium sophoriradicis]PCK80985.1 hypothetical protein CPT34_11210 [Rhizobium sophoriradicis]
MPFVSRTDNGAIDGVFEHLQEGRAYEFLSDDDPALSTFLNASPKVTSVSARQFRLMLRRSGLLDQVKAWVAQQEGEVQDAFEYSGTFVKDSPMMSAGFAAMGFSEQQIEQFFAAAASL